MLVGQTGDRQDGLRDRWDRDMETSQESPPVTVVGGKAARTHGHTFVVVG